MDLWTAWTGRCLLAAAGPAAAGEGSSVGSRRASKWSRTFGGETNKGLSWVHDKRGETEKTVFDIN